MSEVDIEKYVEHQLELVDLEREAEIEEEQKYQFAYSDIQLQRKGVCLVGLRVSGSRTGLGGKTLLDLEKELGSTALLPSHQMRSGDLIAIKPYSKEEANQINKGEKTEWKEFRGVIYRVNDTCVTLSFDTDLPDDVLAGAYRITITRCANDVTFQRMKTGLQELRKMSMQCPSRLVQILFKQRSPSYSSPPKKLSKFFFPMNEPQKNAVEFALNADDLALIHGPPGTGKTTTIAEIIRQLCAKGGNNKHRILVCAPSNVAVDTIVEKLVHSKIAMVRLGHPARLLPSIVPYSLDMVIFHSEAGQLTRDARNERDELLKKLQGSHMPRSERRELYDQLKILKKELAVREKKLIGQVLSQSQVILTTLTGAGSHHLKDQYFDTIIIDEISQAKEADCWSALLKVKQNESCRLILAGDPCQLPPTIKSSKAEEKGMANTLFDRCNKLYENEQVIKCLLTIQYRMNQLIMHWSSKEFYQNKLIADKSVINHVLGDLEGFKGDNDLRSSVLVMIDTAGCDMIEKADDDQQESRMNEGEAEVVKEYVKKLIENGCRAHQMAIITPYHAQQTLLVKMLKSDYPDLEINSVDGFQGREKEIVVISLVRSNDGGNVGFLKERRRLNVAITRAKRHVCIVGDSETLSRGDPFLKRLTTYFIECGDVYSAQQFVDY